jgi:tetratricopeptide (TPR) repeat protein
MPDDRYRTAEALRTQGKYTDAAELFQQLWKEQFSAVVGSKYVQCLRKAGRTTDAVNAGQEALTRYPNDIWVRRELIWAYYDAHVKPARTTGDLSKAIKGARAIVNLGPEDMPLRLTAFAVIDIAKAKGQWRIMSDWCDCLDPTQLSDEASMIDGRRGMSDRERWYFAKTKSLIEQKEWGNARVVALDAMQHYPRQVNFKRWAAVALAGQGKAEEAIAELELIVLKEREEWYILEDLARLHLGCRQVDLAMRYACKGALAPGEHKAKVNLFALLAELGLTLGNLEVAARQVTLSQAIRNHEKWPIPAALQGLEMEVRLALKEHGRGWPMVPQDLGALVGQCRRDWQTGAHAGLPRKAGFIESLPPGKSHGWLRAEDGTRVFFLQNDLPARLRASVDRVTFALAPTWNRTKDERSVRAVAIELATDELHASPVAE